MRETVCYFHSTTNPEQGCISVIPEFGEWVRGRNLPSLGYVWNLSQPGLVVLYQNKTKQTKSRDALKKLRGEELGIWRARQGEERVRFGIW